MKLFTEAGKTANIGVTVLRTAIHCEKSSEAFKLSIGVFAGILLAEWIAEACGMEIPWALIITVEFLIVALQAVLIFQRVFRVQRILMAFSPERESGSFLVNPHQILWASPMGDVPIFNQRGYKVRQIEDEEGVHLVCIGKAGNAFFHEMQRIMPEEKIWKCRKVILSFGSQLDGFSDAKQILEHKEGKIKL